ncbi:sulfite exporter TauE/SafE family protein [Reichenbachiella agarivorans]|uniref:Probable membrane transporter protein n=1 Tax=Reichenbachiella agarivorans TaxID=2979464 RepID=A0ABY6CLV0_9BACT|nr:sulfite exporter TauE/SafE family protein [Reichenbachiella agarivorans]UXP31060.1 sulfite exporter TauE/SafE family protein [Reichenbachiella agarivorans]
MEVYHYLLVFGVGVLCGFINVVAGGGSLLTLPVLIFMGLPPSVANGTNRVGIFMQNVFAVKGFKSKGVSAFPFAIWLSITSVIGAIIGAKVAIDISAELFNRILAIVMVVVLLMTFFGTAKSREGIEEDMSKKKRITSIILFFFIGIYGGFIHAGIGFVIMAVLSMVNKMSLVKVNSIKVFVALVYTFFSLIVFIWEGQIDWIIGLTLGAGSALGGWSASQWSVAKGDKWIRYFLIVAVSGMAIKLWFFS